MLLEGNVVHFAAPKTSYAREIEFTCDTPVFDTSKSSIVFIKGSTVDERDRNDGRKMEKVSLLSSDSYLLSKNSHTMWLLFCEISTRCRLIVAPPSLCSFFVPILCFIVYSFKTTDCYLYHAVCCCHERYILDSLRFINKFKCSVIQDKLGTFIYENCVQDVHTLCTSSTITKIH